jgi:hypothetical protein
MKKQETFDLKTWATTAKEIKTEYEKQGQTFEIKLNNGEIWMDYSGKEYYWPSEHLAFLSPNRMIFRHSVALEQLNAILGKPTREKDPFYGITYTW